MTAAPDPDRRRLPDRPDLSQLKRQARELQRAARGGGAVALAEIARCHPDPVAARQRSYPLSVAQLVLARRYGFGSWGHLRRFVETVDRYGWFPSDPDLDADGGDRAGTFLRLACLSYDEDAPERRTRAAAIRHADPSITGANVYTAAATADVSALRRYLRHDPRTARRRGGPYGWSPLLYLAYARDDPDVAEAAVLEAARQLLAAGADPNDGFLWRGQSTPFTVLTGVFGEGELGPVRQPRHPHSLALARMLLAAGADPNDAQTLYNRMFGRDDDHLRLLFEFGLGTGDDGPWRQRLGPVLADPPSLLRTQLRWAITHGMAARVRLLADHVDVDTPFAGGTSPRLLAVASGHPELLADLGATGPAIEPVEQFVSAVMRADRVRVDAVRAAHPELADALRAQRPDLVVSAAVAGRLGAVELLVEAGFDVNAMGGPDTLDGRPWTTALHHAARSGDLELARTLLALGADPNVRDRRHDATPLEWARQFEQLRAVELLEPLTDIDESRPPAG